MQHVRTLFRARGLAVHAVSCSAPCGGRGPEEEVRSLEVVLPRRGVFVRHRGARRTVADANRALFLAPGEPYRVSHPVAGGDASTVLSVSGERLHEVAEEIGRDVDRHGLPDARPTSARADLLHRRLAAGVLRAGEAPGLEELLLELLAEVLGGADEARTARAPGPAARARQAELVERAQVALVEDPAAMLDLGALARELGCSPFHLSRTFRRATGLTLQRYHERLRLRAALERLLRGPCDLTELALDLGFAHHSHFTNRFKRELGVPPSAVQPGRRPSRRPQRG